MHIQGFCLWRRGFSLAATFLILLVTASNYSYAQTEQGEWCDFDDHVCLMNHLTEVTCSAVSQGLMTATEKTQALQAASIFLSTVSTTPPFQGAMFGVLHEVSMNSPGTCNLLKVASPRTYTGGGTGGGGAGGEWLSLAEELKQYEHEPPGEEEGSYFSFSSYATLYSNSHVSLDFGGMSEWYDPFEHNSDTLARSGWGLRLSIGF